MGILDAISTDEIRQRGSIRDGDVMRLRAHYDNGEALDRADAEALLSLHAATPIQDPQWGRFLVEAITDYIVRQAEPAGYVVAQNARWLVEQISAFGQVITSSELAILVHVLETARWTPPSLSAFALDQIRHAVETGGGPLRAGREDMPGRLLPDEIELAKRILIAFGGETSISVTRVEAESLLAINRAIGPGNSSPAWSTLFVRCLGAAVLASTGHGVPPRRDVAGDIATAPLSLLTAILGQPHGEEQAGAFGPHSSVSVWGTSPLLTPEERALARLERQRLEIVTNEVIEEASDVWLMSCLADRDVLDENELLLLDHIAREAAQLPQTFRQFAAQRAFAA